MTTPRALVAPEILATASPGDVLALDAEEAHHIGGVLRLGQGARISLLDGAGHLADATVHRARRGEVTVMVHGVCLAPPFSGPQLELLVGTLKAHKLDWVVQKTTELGVDRLALVETARSVSRPGPEVAARRHVRLQRIGREAARQSGRAYLMELVSAIPLQEALAREETPGKSDLSPPPLAADLCLVCWEEAPSDASFDVLLGSAPLVDRVRILVGPEGGLTREEVVLAEHHGFRQVSLGPLTLRAETAALATSALAMARLGRLG